ncbi:MAG: protein phosphatase 2C domain-containing protein [Alphaproteobacteria bacterium]
MMTASLVIRSAARTRMGRGHSRNEDAVLDRGAIGLWAVADGMGGHEMGDWASARVVATLSEVGPPSGARQFLDDVRTAIHRADEDMRDAAAAAGPRTVIGCTVVTLLVFDHHYMCLWAGDSRLYRLRGGRLRQVNHDHSRVQEMVDANLLSAEEALSHPDSNFITRAVGASPLELALVRGILEPGDVMLLCSDGLNKTMDDDQIAHCLEGRSPEAAAEVLVSLAQKRGGRDDVTVVVVEFHNASDRALFLS